MLNFVIYFLTIYCEMFNERQKEPEAVASESCVVSVT